MRDIIVIGAGGGGAVAAKELAALGLDVLVLEAGAGWGPDVDWTPCEIDQANSTSGVLRFGPSDRTRPPWPRELGQQGMLWQVAGVGGTTQHYYGNWPRAYPGVFRDTTEPTQVRTTARTSSRSRTATSCRTTSGLRRRCPSRRRRWDARRGRSSAVHRRVHSASPCSGRRPRHAPVTARRRTPSSSRAAWPETSRIPLSRP